METQIPVQEQLPQIRRITRLDDVRRVIPPKQVPLPEKKIKPPQRSMTTPTFFIIGLLFLGVLGFELAVIYKYDKLNKRLYEISVSMKNRIATLQGRLRHADEIRDRLAASRIGWIRNYLDLDSQNKILQYKIDNYGTLSMAKSSKIDALEGWMRVLNARIEAVDAQNEVLAKELNGKNEYIRELTAKLINSIGEQELLINENLRLKGEYERLSKELAILNEQIEAQSAEVKDVNK